MSIVLTFQSPSEPLPTGEYTCKLLSVEQVDNSFDPEKPQLRWTFEVVQAGPHQGRKITGFSSLSRSLQSKAARWTAALLGRAVAPDESVDLSALTGRHCRCVVILKEKPDGSEYSKLDDVKPLRPSAGGQGDPFQQ